MNKEENARKEFFIGAKRHGEGQEITACENECQRLGFAAASEQKKIQDKYLEKALASVGNRGARRGSSRKLTTELGATADGQLALVVEILGCQGWSVRGGKTAQNGIRVWNIYEGRRKIGNLYLANGWWEIDGAALEAYGGNRDEFDATLWDNGVEHLYEIEED